MEYNKQFWQYNNTTLNSEGIVSEIYEKLRNSDVFGAVEMLDNNDKEVCDALREYNVQTHKVMSRPNKNRKKMPPYITEKLPRNKQQYINEIELFFLLGKKIEWKLEDGDAEAFQKYLSFWKRYRLDGLLRQAKRLAGAETESAIVFHLSRDNDNKISVKPFVAARSTNFKLRTLFDQYNTLVAFAYGYRLRQKGKNVLHYDIQTKDFLFYCERTEKGWSIDTYENPTHKINALYFHQRKAWDGADARIDREERLDSKVGDTNNYFADPKAAATADVIANISDPDIAGNMVQLTGQGSRFEYINPPQNSATRQDEKNDLHKSIFFDTMTPDLSYESIKGLGTLSGAAMHNALILGYIKRDIRKEIYGPMIDRMRSVIFAIMKITDESVANVIDDLDVSFSFSDPFSVQGENWDAIIKLYGAGLCSLDTAIREIGLADNIDIEIEKIKEEHSSGGEKKAKTIE